MRIDTLAAAHAECGNFDEAVTWLEKALAIASDAQKAELESHLKLFRDKKPYRQAPLVKPEAQDSPAGTN